MREGEETHPCKESISPYGNGQLFVCGLHGFDDAAELLHEELQLAFVLFYIISHQNCNLEERRKVGGEHSEAKEIKNTEWRI